ncbi:hypothetical protein AXA65_14625 [Chryseobacterium sp. FP211-J200]|nr:hypothetical protein AXA65_14625 [Chryseobacterium sp. FP211-J200]
MNKCIIIKINQITKIFIIFILIFCILMNVIEIIRFYEFINITLSFFVILILSIFIISLTFENYFTTIILLIFNILFWYYTITERKDLSWYDNPFNHYDNVFISFANNFIRNIRIILYRTLGNISLINNLLIWIIILPYRFYKFSSQQK